MDIPVPWKESSAVVELNCIMIKIIDCCIGEELFSQGWRAHIFLNLKLTTEIVTQDRGDTQHMIIRRRCIVPLRTKHPPVPSSEFYDGSALPDTVEGVFLFLLCA